MRKTKFTLTAAGILAGTLAFVGCHSDGQHSHAKGHSHGTAAAKPYPLDLCIVTDEKLGGHGDAYVFVHKGQEVKLCCKGCREDFDKEPAKYLSKLTTK